MGKPALKFFSDFAMYRNGDEFSNLRNKNLLKLIYKKLDEKIIFKMLNRKAWLGIYRVGTMNSV